MPITILSIKKYFQYDIWNTNESKVSKPKWFIIKLLRVIYLGFKGFKEDNCIEKASALTFYTLLAIVPIAAMAFAIAKGFGFNKYLETFLNETFPDKKMIVDQVLEFSNSLIANTQEGVIAGAGIIMLMWSVMKVLNSIELAFNKVWYINKERSFMRKLSDYLTIILLAPLFFTISHSATDYITSFIEEATKTSATIQHFSGIVYFGLNLIPYSLIWISFALVYMIMPNTRVPFKSAMKGGIVAGIMFQILQFGYVHFQVFVSNYNAIYGSFAAIPLLLIWLQTSWLIVLFGAEIAYASQNIGSFDADAVPDQLSSTLQFQLSLYILHFTITELEKDKPSPTSHEISASLGIRHKITKTILQKLSAAELIHEVKTDDEKVFGYRPAYSPEKLSMEFCVKKLSDIGVTNIGIENSTVFSQIANSSLTTNSAKLLKDI